MNRRQPAGRQWLKFVAAIGAMVVVLRVGFAGAEAIGAGRGAAYVFHGLGLFALCAVTTGLLTWAWNGWSKKTGGRRIVLALTPFARTNHRWLPIADEQARSEWVKVHHPAGTLVGGAQCRDCPSIKLECRDERGERYAIYGKIVTHLPWFAWTAGLYVRSAVRPPSTKRRWSVRVFERIGCRWRPLADEAARAARQHIGAGWPASVIAGAWRCRDCGAVRLDGSDTYGELFLLFAELPPEEEPMTAAGIVLVFGRAPRLSVAGEGRRDAQRPAA